MCVAVFVLFFAFKIYFYNFNFESVYTNVHIIAYISTYKHFPLFLFTLLITTLNEKICHRSW